MHKLVFVLLLICACSVLKDNKLYQSNNSSKLNEIGLNIIKELKGQHWVRSEPICFYLKYYIDTNYNVRFFEVEDEFELDSTSLNVFITKFNSNNEVNKILESTVLERKIFLDNPYKRTSFHVIKIAIYNSIGLKLNHK